MSLEIDGSQLEYVSEGDGEPVVLVHGSVSDYRTWQLQRDEFARQVRVIAYSRRYHWPNKPIQEGNDYSMTQHVRDLQTLLHSLDMAPAHLVGHSYGGFLCLLLAIAAPHLVRTLILAEPPVITLMASNPPKLPELFKLLVTRPRTAIALIKLGAKGVVPASKAFRQGDMEGGIRAFGNAVLGPEGYNRLSDSQRAQMQDNLTTLKAELLGSGFVPLEADQVQHVKTPTLLITGAKSIGLFHRLTDQLEALLPHAERVELPGATHMMHQDNASGFNAAALSFIGRHSKGA